MLGGPLLRAADLVERYQRWLNEDARYLLSSAEKKGFTELRTDQERDSFIEAFWSAHNPDPRSTGNRFKDEMEERVAYARERFGVSTDRGRVWVLLGAPDRRHGCSDDGGLYPVEYWGYTHLHLPGLPQTLQLLFYKKNGFGEFVLYSPAMDDRSSLMRPRANGLPETSLELELKLRLDPDVYAAMDSVSVAYNRIQSEEVLARLSLSLSEIWARGQKTHVEATVIAEGMQTQPLSSPTNPAPSNPVAVGETDRHVDQESSDPRAPKDLAGLLQRAGAAIEAFKVSFSSLVAQEVYSQKVSNGNGSTGRKRELLSDLLLVWLPSAERWAEFRDVYQVNGQPVRDRTERLEALFQRPFATAVEQARKITEESVRYNIGDISRDFNVPAYALGVLHPDNRSRFEFKKTKEEDVAGLKCTVIEFSERGPEALFRDKDSGQGILSAGAFWIDPKSGWPVRSLLLIHDKAADRRAKIMVQYRFDQKQSAWVPADMTETYDHPRAAAIYLRSGEWAPRPLGSGSSQASSGPTTIECKAEYANFRRFTVSVTEE